MHFDRDFTRGPSLFLIGGFLWFLLREGQWRARKGWNFPLRAVAAPRCPALGPVRSGAAPRAARAPQNSVCIS